MASTGLVAALAALNVAAWVCYAWDKAQARGNGRRVPEAYLLGLAALGGWPAAKLAQHGLRHKTRKQPFARRLNVIVLGWVAGLVVLSTLATV